MAYSFLLAGYVCLETTGRGAASETPPLLTAVQFPGEGIRRGKGTSTVLPLTGCLQHPPLATEAGGYRYLINVTHLGLDWSLQGDGQVKIS